MAARRGAVARRSRQLTSCRIGQPADCNDERNGDDARCAGRSMTSAVIGGRSFDPCGLSRGNDAGTRSMGPGRRPARGRRATWSASRCSTSWASWWSTALVIDLFAGTGALGLEALSRGAERAIFVERDRENVGLIFRNIATLRYEDRAQVRLADAYRWARSFQPADDRPVVVFLDPPYREYERHAGRLNQMIAQLVEKMPAGSVVALEAGRVLDERILPEFETWDIRRYGSTQIAIK